MREHYKTHLLCKMGYQVMLYRQGLNRGPQRAGGLVGYDASFTRRRPQVRLLPSPLGSSWLLCRGSTGELQENQNVARLKGQPASGGVSPVVWQKSLYRLTQVKERSGRAGIPCRGTGDSKSAMRQSLSGKHTAQAERGFKSLLSHSPSETMEDGHVAQSG